MNKISKLMWVLFWAGAATILGLFLGYRAILYMIDHSKPVSASEASYVAYTDDVFRGNIKQADPYVIDGGEIQLQPAAGYRVLQATEIPSWTLDPQVVGLND